MSMLESAGIEIFSTCPQSKDVDWHIYGQRVADVARWSEDAGCRGILVYTDNSLVDPWLVSQLILQSTTRLCPLVAVQPVYMHPYSVAKMVASLGYFYERRIYLNMVAGGFKNDLIALNDLTPHDERYDRTVEYALIIKRLLSDGSPVSFEGRYYKVINLKMTPPLPQKLFPGILISGSSDAGLAAARAIGATAVKYPKPPGEEEGQEKDSIDSGVRVGIIARESRDEAWSVAYQRFPEDRKGQITHNLAMKISDSQWHHQLSLLGEKPVSEENPYWLGPFQNYKTFCPYLVGSYARVGEELARYMTQGFKTFILDIPPSEEELHHIGVVFREAVGRVRH
jgi:Coenzyme F420-dependent N5,N10-methylene tetrahydromethanopterin reductase and related flavin-dependent oxidoreductases